LSIEYNESKLKTKRPRIVKKDFDTVICPAKEWGIEEVFLKKKKWYAVSMSKKNIEKIKFIALYDIRRKSIRFIGRVKEIKPYKNSGKYQLILDGHPKKIESIKRTKKNPHLAPQNRVYTKIDFFKNAKFLEDVLQKKIT